MKILGLMIVLTFSLLSSCRRIPRVFACSTMASDRDPCIITALKDNSVPLDQLKSEGYWFEEVRPASEREILSLRIRNSRLPHLDSVLLQMDQARIGVFKDYLRAHPHIDNYSLRLQAQVLGMGRYLSIATRQDQYLGGAHGNYFYWCDLVDLQDFHVYSLEKFYQPELLLNLGNNYVREYCRHNRNYFCNQEERDRVDELLGLHSTDFEEAPLCAARTGVFIDFGEVFSHADGHQELFIKSENIPDASNNLHALLKDL